MVEKFTDLPVPISESWLNKETGLENVRVDILCLAYLFPNDVNMLKYHGFLPEISEVMFLELLRRRHHYVKLNDPDNFWVNMTRNDRKKAAQQQADNSRNVPISSRGPFYYYLWLLEQAVLFAVTNCRVPISFFRLLPTFRRAFQHMLSVLELTKEQLDVYIKPSYIDLFYRFYQDFDLVYDVAPHILLVEPSYRPVTDQAAKMSKRFYDFQVFTRSQAQQYSEVMHTPHEWNLDPMSQAHDFRKVPSSCFITDYLVESNAKECGCATEGCRGCAPRCIKCGEKTCHVICKEAKNYVPKDYYLHKRQFDDGCPMAFKNANMDYQDHQYVKEPPGGNNQLAGISSPPETGRGLPQEVHIQNIGNEYDFMHM